LRRTRGRWSSESEKSSNDCDARPTNTPVIDIKANLKKEVEQGRSKHAANISLGSVARPKGIAAAILFLASDKSGFFIDTELRVDGGMCPV
jgi:NAD(P)-dependent dehydrogenase (short-subunit alcohol dehydrogenase family)